MLGLLAAVYAQKIDGNGTIILTDTPAAIDKLNKELEQLIRNKKLVTADSLSIETLKKSTAIGYKEGQANSLNSRGLVQRYLGNYNLSLDLHKQAQQLVEATGDTLKLSRIITNIGIVNKELNNYPASIDAHLSALRLYESINDSMGIAKCYMNLGITYKALSNYNESLNYYLKAENYFRLNKDDAGLIDLLINKLNIYNRNLLLDSSFAVAEELKILLSKKGSKSQQLGALSAMAVSYKHMGTQQLLAGDSIQGFLNLKKASDLYVENIEANNLMGRVIEAAKTRVNLGIIRMIMREYVKSREDFEKSITVFTGKKDFVSLKSTYTSLSDLDSLMANDSSFAYNQRLTFAMQALKNQKLANNMKDSIINEANLKQIEELKTIYETEKKDIKISLLNKENVINEYELKNKLIALHLSKLESEKNQSEIELLNHNNDFQELKLSKTQQELVAQMLEAKAQKANLELGKKETALKEEQLQQAKFFRNLMIGAVLALLLFSVLLFNRYKLKKKIEHQQVLINQRKHISADLHDDVGSTLSSISIYSEAIKNKLNNNEPENVMELVHKIGDNARETISSLSDIVWSINPVNDGGEKVFSRMESFASSMLSSKIIQLHFECDAALSALEYTMEAKQNLFLIFKEIINNSAKYSQAKNVTVTISKDNFSLLMQIIDDGIGFDLNKKSDGNGLKNITQRTHELGGTLEMNSSNKGTFYKLQFPVSKLQLA